MKKLVLIGCLFAVSAFATDCKYLDKIESINELKPKDVICANFLIAEELSKDLPSVIDKYTSLTKVFSSYENLTYDYKISVEKNKLKDISTLKNDIEKMIINRNCTTPDSKHIISIGSIIRHKYYDLNEKFLFEIIINEKICNKLSLN